MAASVAARVGHGQRTRVRDLGWSVGDVQGVAKCLVQLDALGGVEVPDALWVLAKSGYDVGAKHNRKASPRWVVDGENHPPLLA